MTTPFWSVMIPVHQPDMALLREAIGSVIASGIDHARSEIVIVAQGIVSAELQTYLTTLAAQGITITHHTDPGMIANWNACITHARGEWVHILHQDDRVRPGFYAALAEGIALAPHIGAAYTQTAFIDGQGSYLREGHMSQTTAGVVDHWIEHLIANLTVQCPAIVVRRAAYERLGGFSADFYYCTDAEMWGRIASEYPVWFDPRPLAEYRVHAANATHTQFPLPRRWRERRRCLALNLSRLSPAIQPTARRSGEHYQCRLAWSEWTHAWRAASRFVQRFQLLTWLPRLGSLRDLRAIRERRYPTPVPGQAVIRGDDPRAPRCPRVMLLSEFFPHPPDRAVFGVYQRLYRTFQGLAAVGHVDAVFFWSDNYQPPEAVVEGYREKFVETWPLTGALRIISTSTGDHAESRHHRWRALYWLLRGSASFMQNQPTLRASGPAQVEKLRAILQTLQPDLIVAHRTGVTGALIRLRQPLPPVALDLEDIDHIKIMRFHRDPVTNRVGWRARLGSLIARLSERHAALFASITMVCSDTDRTELEKVARRAHITMVPNTAREREPLPPSFEPVALFVGVAYYPPNREAIEWLVSDIWPRVREKVPDARLIIAGEGAKEIIGNKQTPGIEVVGFAPDLDLYYQKAGFAVCPIRRGSGTRIKIIEASFYNRATVATTIGAEGLTLAPGEEILIADEAHSFADACVVLLQNTDQRVAIGRAARAKAMKNYAPARVVERLETEFTNLLPASLKGTRP
jgi:glycosyltransferase involved in cell wall biosynthesis